MTKPRSAAVRVDPIKAFLDGRECSTRHLELARAVQSAQEEGSELHPEAAMFLAQGISELGDPIRPIR